MGGSTRKVTRKSKKEQRKQICKPGLREKPNVKYASRARAGWLAVSRRRQHARKQAFSMLIR